jgi:hypothetical protein
MQNHQPNAAEPAEKEIEVFQSLSHLFTGRVVVLRDGRVAGFHQPEPQHLLRKYEHAQALREIKRESRVKAALEAESAGFVERIRTALGIA